MYQVRESSRKDKFKYFCFHKSYDLNTYGCVQLKNEIEGMIIKGWLTGYTEDIKRGWENSPKNKISPYAGKFPQKMIETIIRAKGKILAVEKRNGTKGKPIFRFYNWWFPEGKEPFQMDGEEQDHGAHGRQQE